MRIAHITGDVLKNKITGPKESLTNLSNSIERLGHEANIYSINSSDEFCYNGKLVKKISSLDVKKYDVLVFVGVYYPIYIPLILKSKLFNKMVVISPRSNLMVESIKYSLKKKIYLSFFKHLIKSDIIHFLSDAERKNSICRYQKYIIAGNGVNSEKIYISNKYDHKSPAGEDEITIGYMGRLDIRHKGIDILFDAINLLSSNVKHTLRTKYKFVFYGPAQNDFDVKEYIKDLPVNIVVEYNSQPLVTALEKKNFFSRIDYFIHSSRYEGLPQAVLESIANGIPVIVSQATNLSEEVLRHNLGFAYDSGSVELCEVLTSLSDSIVKDNISFLQNNCKRYYQEKLQWDNVAIEYVNKLQSNC